MPYTPSIPDDLNDYSLEERIDLAILAIHQGSTSPSGQHIFGIRQAARVYDIARETLRKRFNGTTRSRVESHIHQRALTPAEEEVLVTWVKEMGRRGLPLTYATITESAADIAGHEIGESWGKRFMKRHPELKVKWTTGLESCRARALNPSLVQEFYDLLEEVREEYNIEPSNTYNMDEKGVQLGVGSRVAAIVDRDQKDVYQIENGDHQLVTIIETVCADGSYLHLTVIYQGKRRDLEWGRHNPCKAS